MHARDRWPMAMHARGGSRAVNSILVHISLNLYYQHTKLYVLLCKIHIQCEPCVPPCCTRAAVLTVRLDVDLWIRRRATSQTHRFHTMPTVSGPVQGPSKGNKCSLLTGKKTGESCSQMYGSHGDGTNGTLARITLAAVPPHPYPPPRHSDQLGSFSAARCIHRGTLHLRCSRSRAVRGSALSWLHSPQLACSLISSYHGDA